VKLYPGEVSLITINAYQQAGRHW